MLSPDRLLVQGHINALKATQQSGPSLRLNLAQKLETRLVTATRASASPVALTSTRHTRPWGAHVDPMIQGSAASYSSPFPLSMPDFAPARSEGSSSFGSSVQHGQFEGGSETMVPAHTFLNNTYNDSSNGLDTYATDLWQPALERIMAGFNEMSDFIVIPEDTTSR